MIVRAFIVTASVLTLAACSGGSTEKSETTTTETSTTATEAGSNATAEAANTAAAAGGNTAAGGTGAPSPTDTATVSGAQFAQFTGAAAAGEKVFIQCKTCHVVDPGQNRIGPSLHQLVGRSAGSVPGYTYSAANKNSGITWSKEKLFQYLENPQRVVPGTKMAFAGIPDPQKRADLIEYLATK